MIEIDNDDGDSDGVNDKGSDGGSSGKMEVGEYLGAGFWSSEEDGNDSNEEKADSENDVIPASASSESLAYVDSYPDFDKFNRRGLCWQYFTPQKRLDDDKSTVGNLTSNHPGRN